MDLKESIFHRLYDQYHQDVFQFLIYLVKDRSVAEDCLMKYMFVF